MNLTSALIVFKRLLINRRTQQVGTLYVALIGLMILGFVSSVINTRTLGPSEYGDFKFVGSVFQLFALAVSLGFSTTGSQIIAHVRDSETHKNELIGSILFLSLFLSFGGLLITIIFAIVGPLFLNNNVGSMLILFSPLVVLMVYQSSIEGILQGDNRIHELSLFRILPAALFVVSLLVAKYLNMLNLFITLLLLFVTTAVVIVYFLSRLSPSYVGFREHIRSIGVANKKYGWHVYIGSLSGVGTAYLSSFMISYYLDNTNVGYFSLALTLTMPLSQISSVVGTTYFNEFAKSNYIPGKVTSVVVGLSLITLLLFILLIRPFVVLIYTNKFLEVASLATTMALGSVLYGFGDYFNRFLGAHGQGKALRNGAIMVGIVNVLGYFILIKYFGTQGAAVTRVVAGVIYFGMMLMYYGGFRKEIIAHESVTVSS